MTDQDALRYARNPTVRAWVEIYSREHVREAHPGKHTEGSREGNHGHVDRASDLPLPEIAKLLAQLSDGRNN